MAIADCVGATTQLTVGIGAMNGIMPVSSDNPVITALMSTQIMEQM